MLYTKAARFEDLHEEIGQMFQDVQLELIACEACSEYHPPEIHLERLAPCDATEPEEA